MRSIGEIEDRQTAERFASFAAARGIDTELREDDGRHGIWVLDEDRMEEATSLFDDFVKAPTDARFDAPRRTPPRGSASDKLPRAAQGDRARFVDVRRELFGRRFNVGNVTLALIVISIALTLISNLPGASGLVRALYYSEYYGRGFPEIMDGQVWRLFTPIFLHGGILHLLFNMMWLYQLGGSIETNEGSRYLLIMTLLFAVIVDTAQYLVSGPLFVGMSGVVYGLLGYIWMMSKYEAGSRYVLAQQTVGFMVIWLVICLVGIIPNVANTQHVAGFILGTAWGFLRSGRLTAIKRRRKYERSL